MLRTFSGTPTAPCTLRSSAVGAGSSSATEIATLFQLVEPGHVHPEQTGRLCRADPVGGFSVERDRELGSCRASASASARDTRRRSCFGPAGRRPASRCQTNVRREHPTMRAASSSVIPSSGLVTVVAPFC